MINKLHAQLYAEILDRIKWNSKPHSPEIKEAARNPKRTISPSLMWAEGVGGLTFQSILSRSVCVQCTVHTTRWLQELHACKLRATWRINVPSSPAPAFEMWKPNVILCTSFQQLLDMLKFYTGFEINDVTGKNLVYKCASVYFTLPSFI